MANDGVHEVRISILEKRMDEVLKEIHVLRAEMRKDYATKAVLARLEEKIALLIADVKASQSELKTLHVECAQRFTAIESQLAHFATKDDVRKMGLRLILASFSMQIAMTGLLLHFLR